MTMPPSIEGARTDFPQESLVTHRNNETFQASGNNVKSFYRIVVETRVYQRDFFDILED